MAAAVVEDAGGGVDERVAQGAFDRAGQVAAAAGGLVTGNGQGVTGHKAESSSHRHGRQGNGEGAARPPVVIVSAQEGRGKG